MSEATRKGISYVTVGAICAILGALLSLRIYAGLPERVGALEARQDKNDAKWAAHSTEVTTIRVELEGRLVRMETKQDEILRLLKARP